MCITNAKEYDLRCEYYFMWSQHNGWNVEYPAACVFIKEQILNTTKRLATLHVVAEVRLLSKLHLILDKGAVQPETDHYQVLHRAPKELFSSCDHYSFKCQSKGTKTGLRSANHIILFCYLLILIHIQHQCAIHRHILKHVLSLTDLKHDSLMQHLCNSLFCNDISSFIN